MTSFPITRRRTAGRRNFIGLPAALIDIFVILWVATLLVTTRSVTVVLEDQAEVHEKVEAGREEVAVRVLAGGLLEVGVQSCRPEALPELCKSESTLLLLTPEDGISIDDYFQVRASLNRHGYRYLECHPQ